MWQGKYGFFDYKYNIQGYEGQDYMAPIQYIMTAIGVIGIVLLLIFLRRMKKENSKKLLGIMGIVFTSIYIIKTIWESYWDIKTGRGFNIWILPFDTCSLFMPGLIIAGFSKKDSKLEVFASTFLATIGLVGGVANFIFLRGLKYYPMFSFGALYSYFWHVAMVFVALFIPINRFHEFEFIDIVNGMVFVLIACVYVIPFNYITGTDFMLLNEAGGAPILEDVASSINKIGLTPIVNLMMVATYFAFTAIFVTIYHFAIRPRKQA